MAMNFGLLNTNIPAEIGAMPGNALAARRQRIQQDDDRAMGREQAQMTNALSRMQLTKAQGDMDEESAYKNALRGVQGGNYEQAMPDLLQASPSRALALQKQLGETKKRDLDLTIERFKVIDRTAGQFAANPTRQTAVAGLSQLQSLGIDPAIIQQMSQRLNETPDEQLPQLAREFLLSTQEGIKQKIGEIAPQYRMEDFGGYKQVVQVNPGAGPAGPQGERFGKTISPSDAVAQQGNQAMRDLLLQERQMRVDEGRAKADERDAKRRSTIARAEQTLSVVDQALSHPGLSAATGLQGQLDPRNYFAGTDAKNFQVVIDQIGGKAFLEAFESLKGGGQITEIEGQKATAAIARLNRAQSTEEFVKSLKEFRDIVQAGVERLKQQGGGAQPSAPQAAPQQTTQPAAFDSMPNPAQYSGKAITDTASGIRYRSNGSQWVRE